MLWSDSWLSHYTKCSSIDIYPESLIYRLNCPVSTLTNCSVFTDMKINSRISSILINMLHGCSSLTNGAEVVLQMYSHTKKNFCPMQAGCLDDSFVLNVCACGCHIIFQADHLGSLVNFCVGSNPRMPCCNIWTYSATCWRHIIQSVINLDSGVSQHIWFSSLANNIQYNTFNLVLFSSILWLL